MIYSLAQIKKVRLLNSMLDQSPFSVKTSHPMIMMVALVKKVLEQHHDSAPGHNLVRHLFKVLLPHQIDVDRRMT
ncbi:hypothetical protein BLA27_11035 [Brucella cytisi]|uniref:Uncharacterized protein n=1 Tax=Brucella cytisi TaxID=407152 RepID=A0A1J6HZ07_9HYPH|nr:hypothetical protein BLA27_11035 [Brucella cytisi]